MAAHGALWCAPRCGWFVPAALRPGHRRRTARAHRSRVSDRPRSAARHRSLEHLGQGRVPDARPARRAVGGAPAWHARRDEESQARCRDRRIPGRRPCPRADESGPDPRREGFPPTLKILFALLIASAHSAEPLPALHAAREGVAASGVSSGGYMAVQLHVAHSATISGVGVIAGGPYYCAQGSLFTALYNCLTPGVWTPVPPAVFLKSEAEIVAASGRIDATTHLS